MGLYISDNIAKGIGHGHCLFYISENIIIFLDAMDNGIPTKRSDTTEKHWSEAIINSGPKKDLVYIMMTGHQDIKEAVIDFSSLGVYNRLTEVLENIKIRFLSIMNPSSEEKGVNIDNIISIEFIRSRGRTIPMDPEKIADLKPVEVEVILSNGVGIRGTVYLRHSGDVIKRINNSTFLNLVNVNELSLSRNGNREWKKAPCRIMSLNIKHICIITKLKSLYKSAKVLVDDKESGIPGKKKLVDKLVPLDYVEDPSLIGR